VFPGDETKVFDLAESNLKNYIEVLGEFLTQFFAVAQIPPQYLLSRMANLSGDALAGAESTLSSLVTDLQTAAGESLESVMRLANRARGETQRGRRVHTSSGPRPRRGRSRATVDAITKLIAVGVPDARGGARDDSGRHAAEGEAVDGAPRQAGSTATPTASCGIRTATA
jgi:hypothetical protein